MTTVEELLEGVGARIRQLRKERGWSRRELGERARRSERLLAEIEAGRGNPSLRSLAEIAAALGTSPALLLAPPTTVVALLGLRGAGKSTVGKALASRLGLSFVELDARVEEAAGLSLNEIWELHGEEYYRQVERETLESILAAEPRFVLATGGGIVTAQRTFALLRQHAVTFWLRARPEIHWSRVVAQGDHRPMSNDPLAMERLRHLLTEREDLYRQAHHIVDVSDVAVDDVVESIRHLLRADAA